MFYLVKCCQTYLKKYVLNNGINTLAYVHKDIAC